MLSRCVGCFFISVAVFRVGRRGIGDLRTNSIPHRHRLRNSLPFPFVPHPKAARTTTTDS